MQQAHLGAKTSAALNEVLGSLLMGALAYATLISVDVLWKNSLLAAMALLATGFAMAHFSREKRILLAYPLALIFGTLFEMVSITSGAWAYAKPEFLGVPLFLFFVWGNAGLYLFDTYRRLQFFLGKTSAAGSTPVPISACFIFTTVSVWFLWREPFLLAFLLLLTAGTMLLRRGKSEVAAFLFAAFFGTFAEFSAITYGIWSYPQAEFLFGWPLRVFNWVPIWLPLLWGIAALGFIEISEYLQNRHPKRSFL